MQILLTGATGQIGAELVTALAPLGRVVAPSRDTFDLAKPDALRAAVRQIRPDVIVNAAAYTAVDRAETEIALCMAINADAPRVLAEEAARLGALIVQFSTDYVFDGGKRTPYVEEDEPAPLNVYGRSKLMAEQGVAAAGGRHLVLRTSWVYGTHGSNFLLTMLRLARVRTELRVVADQTGAPTWSRSVAEATASLLSAEAADRGAIASGILHLASAGTTTWYDFAQAILAGDPDREAQRCERLVAVTTADYASVAARPRYAVLDCGKLQQRFGIALPDWRDELAAVLASMDEDHAPPLATRARYSP